MTLVNCNELRFELGGPRGLRSKKRPLLRMLETKYRCSGNPGSYFFLAIIKIPEETKNSSKKVFYNTFNDLREPFLN